MASARQECTEEKYLSHILTGNMTDDRHMLSAVFETMASSLETLLELLD